jgi:hypothetical protein
MTLLTVHHRVVVVDTRTTIHLAAVAVAATTIGSCPPPVVACCHRHWAVESFRLPVAVVVNESRREVEAEVETTWLNL